jgi:hypothetical protein
MSRSSSVLIASAAALVLATGAAVVAQAADTTPAASPGITCTGRAPAADGSFDLHCTLPQPAPTPTPTVAPTTVPPTTLPATTPPRTTAPPTTPPAGELSHASVMAGAGVPSSATLKPLTGALKANTTYDGYAIPASALSGTVGVSGLVLRNCALASGAVFSGNDVTIDHCSIHGGVSLSGGDRFVFTNNAVTGWDDALHITSDSGPVNTVTVRGNWLHAPAPSCSDHSDGIQLLGVTGAQIDHNVIDLGRWIQCGSDPDNGPLNGAFQVEVTQGPVSGVVIDHNWLNGGGYTLRVYAGCQGVHITANAFGRDARWGPFDTLKAGAGVVEFTGNTWEDTGAAITARG